MTIGIILTRRSPNFVSAAEILRARGVGVELIEATELSHDVATAQAVHDLYVIKSGRGIALALAGLLHAKGARTHWPYPLAVGHKDKVAVAATLVAHGLPVPETRLAARLATLADFVAKGPVMLKPIAGSRGEGIRTVRSAHELDACGAAFADGPIMAQRFLEPDEGGSYIVAYRIGEEICFLRRRWPLEPGSEAGELFEPPKALVELASRCGDVFDVDLYSVDFVVSGGRPYVVDMSLHAGFVGVPEAPARLADYLQRLC